MSILKWLGIQSTDKDFHGRAWKPMKEYFTDQSIPYENPSLQKLIIEQSIEQAQEAKAFSTKCDAEYAVARSTQYCNNCSCDHCVAVRALAV